MAMLLLKQDLSPWLQSLIAAGERGAASWWARIITEGPFRGLSSFLSLPLVCPTPAEKWTSGGLAVLLAPSLRPRQAHTGGSSWTL